MTDTDRNLDHPPEPGLSRVILEPVMERAAELDDVDLVDAIGTELAGRVWQGVNPYAAWVP